MQKISSYGVLILTLLVTWFLHKPINRFPPFAKFLDPFQGFWQNAEGEKVNLPAQLHLSGLIEPVHVYFDETFIPHIEARNDRDLYFAQGYITAFHRLWQMEFQTHAAAGRLSEIIGPLSIAYDRLQRRKGMVYSAKNALDIIQKDSLVCDMVAAYTAGVNAYIESLNYKKLPIEYKLLSYNPEPWTPFKTAITGMQMADVLTGFYPTLEQIQASEVLDEGLFEFLFPANDLVDEPVIPKGTAWSFKALNSYQPVKEQGENVPYTVIDNRRRASSSLHRPVDGSNNWAVSGKRTVTGYPFLAADLHINLGLPSSWYAIHLVSPCTNVTGASLPGTPGMLIGFNESIAWGITNAAWYVRDWYTVNFKDNTRSEYYCDSLLLKSQFVVETIKVKNAETVYDTVVYTHVGPIVYDECFNDPHYYKNLAMRWEGHYPGNEIFAFYLLAKSKNLVDCEEALKYHHVPIQNFVFASIRNDIALRVAGNLPVRLKDENRLVKSTHLSLPAYIPTRHQPAIVNPSRGYVSSANQRTTDKTYPYHYYQFFEEGYRNRRINQILSSLQKVDVKSMMRLQNDTYNLAAQENLLFLLSFIDVDTLDTVQNQAYQALKTWDFENEPEQVAPSIFSAWQKEINSCLWGTLISQSLSLPLPTFYQTMYILKNHSSSPYLILGPYNNLKELITDSFKKAIAGLQNWQNKNKRLYKWADYHPINIPHLAQIKSFGLTGVRVGGGEHIVNANQDNHGASIRLLVSLEKMPRGWLMYPGGQTGNPGSPYYTRWVDDWCKGRYVPLSLKLSPVDKRIKGRAQFLLPDK